MSKPKYYVVDLSGGKDSTAMLLHLIELNEPINEIIFCDTGLEFPAMYDHLDKLEQDINRSITRVKPEKPFEYWMFEHDSKHRNPTMVFLEDKKNQHGYSWPGPRRRWCTSRLKDIPRDQYLNKIKKDYDLVFYIGIAADESSRLDKDYIEKIDCIFPLVDWGWTEADCLKYCKDHGYNWDGMYDHFSRVSCWCCPLQSLDELRQLYHYYPDLWNKLKEWDSKTYTAFRKDYTIEQLEIRFDYEDECMAAKKYVKNKDFFAEIKRRIAEAEQNR